MNIRNVLEELEPYSLKHQSTSTTVMLSPSMIHLSPRRYGFLDARAIFHLDVKGHANLVHALPYQTEKRGKTITNTFHIFESTLEFPPVGEQDAGEDQPWEIIEVPINNENVIPYRLRDIQTGKSYKDRIEVACTCDRYWFKVPKQLYDGDDTTCGSVCIKEDYIAFTNKAYAHQFAELNDLKDGRWFTSTDRRKYEGSALLFSLSVAMILIGLFLASIKLGTGPLLSPSRILWGVAGFLLLGAGIFGIVTTRGQPV